MSEWFKEPVLKTGDAATHRGFESHPLRHNEIVKGCYYEVSVFVITTLFLSNGKAVYPPRSDALAYDDLFLRIGVVKLHRYVLGRCRRYVLANIVGADRELAMSAVDEHGELDHARPPEVK